MAADRRMVGFVVSEVAGMALLLFLAVYYPFLPVGHGDPLAPGSLVAYALLFLGPLLVFLPPSLALRLGPTWLLGAGSWALFGYVLLFIGAPAREEASFFTYVVFLALLFVALASTLAVVAAATGRRFLPQVSAAVAMMRALRQGSLLSLFLVALLALAPLGALNWLNGLLIFVIVSLTEFFFITRD